MAALLATEAVCSMSLPGAAVTFSMPRFAKPPPCVYRPGLLFSEEAKLDVGSECSTIDSSAAETADKYVGTASCPTVGSALHEFGTCKPCAFVHKAGCNSGVACQFCHLCSQGEKRRRKRTAKVQRRAATLIAEAVVPAWLH
mmetsp:Transcript_52820/g.122954  ORF Transcript_52820/g.122954 Transcript_52820/m.122954 type:complete len:142 (-) Transcript_52820:55-480(-)|eukprot:CAMPEP_0171059420 /NCGR_PEP_ID=MMETSP0766_2-20121228/3167_1 /TAXON_ID=439317 /ORGANISM="Gambierdiscus australes, Strain CAWD 149" /LENGTH=141 /DNA_ID=CAMNT_0011514855 /DNA_START=76 /DNA_END=501 /DNA_ORIENTATION=+